jgi:predicted esterase
MAPRWLLSGLLVFVASLVSYSQQIIQHYDSGNTYREVVDAICNDPNNMCHYFKSVGWNDSQIKEYTYRGIQNGYVVEFMNWRMVFPLGYNKNRAQGYPIILMLHGGGESGRKWGGTTFLPTEDRFDNNGYNVIHGGAEHLAAVNRNPNLSNAFPGIVIWPQVSYNGAWENGWDNGNLSQNGRMTAQIVEWVIQNYNGDPDRVAVHGLSNGAKGSWDIAAKRPDLFAAVLPMSGVGSNLTPMADSLVTTPLWLFQGGTDTNPRPQAAVDWIAGLQQIGGNPRYTYYPTLGHGTWTTAYAEPDFFPWILSKNKKDIYVFGGEAKICPGGALKLGFSANLPAYQWFRNDTLLVGATDRYYSATKVGIYKVRFKRNFAPKIGEDVNQWFSSNPMPVGTKSSSAFIPLITNSGSTFETVDQVGVDNKITLTAPIGYPRYDWYKGTNLVVTGTSHTWLINPGDAGRVEDEGEYSVKVLESTGCLSAVSNKINVTWKGTQPTSPKPTTPTIVAASETKLNLNWTDYNSELGYELWRFRFADNGYTQQPWTLIKTFKADSVTYVDKGLRPEAKYFYVIRALLSNGQAIFSSETPWPYGVPLPDYVPPTSPTNLIASNIKDTQATLTWDASLDNDIVYKYEIFNGSTLLTSVTGGIDGNPLPATTINLTGLVTGYTYLLSVRAVDFRGNYSPFSEVVIVPTLAPANGLTYKYYQFTGTMPGNGGAQLVEPRANNSFDFTQTPIATGTVGTFDISPRQQNDNFVFAFDGFIDIPSSGNYWFYTSSDDGSRLYINGSLLVNNDGAHGTTEVKNNVSPYNGITIPLSAGKIPIRVTFFEQGGGEVLTVSWQKSGGFAQQVIPASALFQTGTTIINYYSKANGDLTDEANWSENTDETGANPTNFTGALNYFNIRNRSTADINSTWTVSGAGSKIIVGDGTDAVALTLNAAVTGLVDASNNATININHTTLPQFGVLNANSTVNFIQTGNVTIPTAMYGNVNLATANQYTLPQNNTIVQGNFSIENGVTTTGVANNLSTLRIGGDLNINNTSVNPFPTNGPNQYSLVFTGSKSHTVSFATAVDPTLFSIQADLGDTISFTGLGVGGRTFTVGSSQGGGLTLKGGAKLNLGNNNLIVTGRGTINPNNETGALSMQGGELTLSTTATQNNSLYFSANDFVSKLTTSTPAANRVSILTTLNVNNLVTVNGGELNAGEGYLVLRSTSDNAGGTARIGPLVNGGAKVTGKINAQRYMSGEGRIYRYISSPVKGITAATLQQYFPITGNFVGTSTGPGLSANASMFHYNETSNPQYQPFPAINNLDTLRRGKGYTPFIREATDSIVMQFIGEPYQGTIPFALLTGTNGVGDTGWNLLGNPYAAPIQWTGGNSGGWVMSGVNSVIYIRENDTSLPGGFRWRSSDGSKGLAFDGTIAPGQAFWVRTTTLNPTLTISEKLRR